MAAGWRMYPARGEEFAKLLENIIYLPAFGDFERWKQRVFWDRRFSNRGLCCPEGSMLELVEFPVSDCANYCEVPAHRGHSGRDALRSAAQEPHSWVTSVVLESQIHLLKICWGMGTLKYRSHQKISCQDS